MYATVKFNQYENSTQSGEVRIFNNALGNEAEGLTHWLLWRRWNRRGLSERQPSAFRGATTRSVGQYFRIPLSVVIRERYTFNLVGSQETILFLVSYITIYIFDFRLFLFMDWKLKTITHCCINVCLKCWNFVNVVYGSLSYITATMLECTPWNDVFI